MQKNHLAAAVAGAILTLSAAANAAVVDVGSDKTLTYDVPSTVADSHNVTSGKLTLDAGGNDLTFTSASKENYAALDARSSFVVQNGNVDIRAGTLTFESANATTNNPGNPAGDSHFSAWLNGNAALTIEVDKLHVGTAEQGGDRAFQMKNSGNSLTIRANEIVSYQGDGFINAQGKVGETANVVSIGSAQHRVGRFESHTSWGDQDYGYREDT